MSSVTTPPDFLQMLLDDIATPPTSVLDMADDMDDNTLPTTIDVSIDDELPEGFHTSNGNGTNKIGSCIVTIFPPTDEKKWLLPNTYFSNTSIIANWLGQFEIAPDTQELHAHIFMQFHNALRPRFTTIREAFSNAIGKGCQIDLGKKNTKNSRDCAVNYCLKPATRLPGADAQFIWPHNKDKLAFNQALWDKRSPKKNKPSKEDKAEERRVWIESKPKYWSWDQIVHENEESKALFFGDNAGKAYHAGRHAETPRRTIDNVIIMYGAGGTGKTTLAKKWAVRDGEDFQERYYRRNPDDGAFWGGGRVAYQGQRVIHLEEFCGQEAFYRFKEICDIGAGGPNVNVKNGGVQLNHDTVIITSNHHPAAFYRNVWDKDAKQFHPFWRRISQVWFFPSHKPDGSMNMPETDDAYYYIDQTEDWKNMMGDYTNACNHASEHWPLKDIDIGGGMSPNFNLGAGN